VQYCVEPLRERSTKVDRQFGPAHTTRRAGPSVAITAASALSVIAAKCAEQRSVSEVTSVHHRKLANLEAATEVARTGRGYSGQQATRPQTLGYGLTDSPAGQAAWIAEKFRAWTDNNGHPEDAVSRQKILDEISVYWFTASAASSARLYWESVGSFRDTVTAPSGLSVYPRDITRPSRREAELRFTDLRWFAELPRGGHFAALEQPESLVEQVRGFFRLVR
jgi:hypothetical protein